PWCCSGRGNPLLAGSSEIPQSAGPANALRRDKARACARPLFVREAAVRSILREARSRIRRGSAPGLSQDGIKLDEHIVNGGMLVVAVPAGFLGKRFGLWQQSAARSGEIEVGPLLGEALLVLERNLHAYRLVFELPLLVDRGVGPSSDYFHHQHSLVLKFP